MVQSRTILTTPPPSTLAGVPLFCSSLPLSSSFLTDLARIQNSHIDLPVSWPHNTPPSTIHSMETYLTSHTLALGKIASAGGVPQSAYASEADYHESEWQHVWYGEENYR